MRSSATPQSALSGSWGGRWTCWWRAPRAPTLEAARAHPPQQDRELRRRGGARGRDGRGDLLGHQHDAGWRGATRRSPELAGLEGLELAAHAVELGAQLALGERVHLRLALALVSQSGQCGPGGLRAAVGVRGDLELLARGGRLLPEPGDLVVIRLRLRVPVRRAGARCRGLARRGLELLREPAAGAPRAPSGCARVRRRSPRRCARAPPRPRPHAWRARRRGPRRGSRGATRAPAGRWRARRGAPPRPPARSRRARARARAAGPPRLLALPSRHGRGLLAMAVASHRPRRGSTRASASSSRRRDSSRSVRVAGAPWGTAVTSRAGGAGGHLARSLAVRRHDHRAHRLAGARTGSCMNTSVSSSFTI